MKVDYAGFFRATAIADEARNLEKVGYDAVWAAETSNDAFVGLAVASGATSTLGLGTGIAIAFARSPMTVAASANDLQQLSGGRFLLGLGSQIKPHITKRYSMPWSAPAARMNEFVLALHAIWDSWHDGKELKFVGEHYTHTLMTPMFNPGPNDFGRPPVYLAGVGPAMTETAGAVANGFICHPFTTRKYVEEVTLPALERGRAKDERGLGPLDIAGMPFTITGTSDKDIDEAILLTKRQMAFYGSTPAYKPVLDLHGFGDLHDTLNAMSKRGEWDAMALEIPDELVELMAVIGRPDEIPVLMHQRFGDLLHRVSLDAMYESDPALWPPIVAALRAL